MMPEILYSIAPADDSAGIEAADRPLRNLLHPRREWPRRRRAAEQRDELAPGAVGTRVTSCPPLRSVHAAFPHTAPTSGV